jgi:hypothetical protein
MDKKLNWWEKEIGGIMYNQGHNQKRCAA